MGIAKSGLTRLASPNPQAYSFSGLALLLSCSGGRLGDSRLAFHRLPLSYRGVGELSLVHSHIKWDNGLLFTASVSDNLGQMSQCDTFISHCYLYVILPACHMYFGTSIQEQSVS